MTEGNSSSVQALEALGDMIRGAKRVPMSASAMISREDALGLVQSALDSLPKEHEEAKEVLGEREKVIAAARTEAAKIIEDAKAEQARILDRTEVVQEAKKEARRIRGEAEKAAARLTHQADDYVDAKLASFEILLSKVVRTVGRGRQQLQRRLEASVDELPPLELDDSGEISGPIAAPDGDTRD